MTWVSLWPRFDFVISQDRLLASAAALEVAFLTFEAASVFSTPSGPHAHTMPMPLGLLALAGALALYAIETWSRRQGTRDPLALLVLGPNAIILLLALSGAFNGRPGSDGLVAGLIACGSLAMCVAAMRLARTRMAGSAESATP